MIAGTELQIGLHSFRGVLTKFLRMLFGREFRIDSLPEPKARAAFSFPLQAGARIYLPERVEEMPQPDLAFRYYKVLAAHLAARHEFGSFSLRLGELPGFEGRAESGTQALEAFAAAFSDPGLISALMRLCETVRIDAAIARKYRGLAAEIAAVNRTIAGKLKPDTLSGLLIRCALSVDHGDSENRAALRETAASFFAPLRSTHASVRASALQARALYAWISELLDAATAFGDKLETIDGEAEPLEELTRTAAGESAVDQPDDAEKDSQHEFDRDASGSSQARAERQGSQLSGGRSRSARQTRNPSDSRGALEFAQARDTDGRLDGVPLKDVAQHQARQIQELRAQLAEAGPTARSGQRFGSLLDDQDDLYYSYDEWDYKAADYRRGWCRLREVELTGDAGEFYRATLERYARLVPVVRHHFQRIRPQALKMVRGLEDGEELDLERAVEARVDRLMKQSPDPRLYRARQKEARDVATLFLLDMSASTDEPLRAKPGPVANRDDVEDWLKPWYERPPEGRRRRIIDINKEALVIMVQALEEIGDSYAIMGFSGHGRHNVEFYVIKEFNWPLNDAVKARIGAIEPRRSTRMGTAIRHAREKLRDVTARSRHVFLLSDGFPQDFDYGEDARSHIYGLQDTMVALRELEMAGAMPFCVTVDRCGHDYLRQMCRASRYLVIEDITSLPRELPKIYEQVVRW
jgi:nitric oxide reductase NorD protein